MLLPDWAKLKIRKPLHDARWLLALCLGFWLTLSSADLKSQPYYTSTARPKLQIDTIFPFDIPLLASRGLSDTAFTRSDFMLEDGQLARPVVMLFWLTTCGPCKAEMEAIALRYADWKERFDFDFLPISIDFPGRRAGFHARASEYPWTSYWDYDREFLSVMPGGLNGVPQLFVMDTRGKIVLHRRKYRPDDVQMLEEVLARDASRSR